MEWLLTPRNTRNTAVCVMCDSPAHAKCTRGQLGCVRCCEENIPGYGTDCSALLDSYDSRGDIVFDPYCRTESFVNNKFTVKVSEPLVLFKASLEELPQVEVEPQAQDEKPPSEDFEDKNNPPPNGNPKDSEKGVLLLKEDGEMDETRDKMTGIAVGLLDFLGVNIFSFFFFFFFLTHVIPL